MFPNETDLINQAWHLINQNPRWSGDENALWRESAREWREKYHEWLSFHIFTHQNDLDEYTTGELIETLKMVCPCGGCDGCWISRDEAEEIIRRLKHLAVLERDSGLAG